MPGCACDAGFIRPTAPLVVRNRKRFRGTTQTGDERSVTRSCFRSSSVAEALAGSGTEGSDPQVPGSFNTPPASAPRLYEGRLVVKTRLDSQSLRTASCRGSSSAHLSIASSREDQASWERLRVRKSERAVYAARRKAAPPGAAALKGSFAVSMCQIASVTLRAMSTWATLAPRCLPSRRLVRW